MAITNNLHGFKPVKKADLPRRLVVSVSALDKCGKTRFALTSPGPLRYINIDTGLEGVIEKEMKRYPRKEITVSDYSAEWQEVRTAKANKMAQAVRLWEKIYRDWMWGIQQPGTTIMDTASEGWEIIRLAEFGKLTQVMPHHYGPVNQMWEQMVKAVYSHSNNAILLHRLKEEWQTKMGNGGKEISFKTGKYERQGYKSTGFLVQVNVRLYKEPGLPSPDMFQMLIENSRHNPELDGMVLGGEQIDFAELASMAVEGTDPDEWR